MPKPQGTLGQITDPGTTRTGFTLEPDPDNVIQIPDVTGGIKTSLSRGKTPSESCEEALNARIRFGKLARRPGTSQYFTDVDNEAIYNLITFVDQSANIYLVRVTPARISVDAGGGSWVDYATSLTLTRRASYAAFVDNLYLATGDYKIRQVDFSAHTAAEIAAAPAAKYITNFAERTIGANIGAEPYKIKWPIDADPTDWTGTGSGEENLVSGVSDLSDAIVGLFGFDEEMIILRNRSIWLAYRQPYADSPFRFVPAYSGEGCDMPHTAVKVPGGIIFGNSITRKIYFYQIGDIPRPVSKDIKDELFSQVADLNFSQAAFDDYNAEYHVGEAYTSGSPNMRKIWVVNLDTGGWTDDDSPLTTCLSRAAGAVSGLVIDDLTGYIDDLSGTIDSLTTGGTLSSEIFKGYSGKIFYHPAEASRYLDYDGSDFYLTFISPNLGGLSNRRTLQDAGFSAISTGGCTVEISASKDKITWEHVITKAMSASSSIQQVGYRRQRLSGNDLYLRLRVSSGDFALKSYWLRVHEKGQQR